MILRALLRFVRSTPWSSSMALGGMTLAVMSIVAVHLVSLQVAAQMDKLVPAPLQAFNFVLHKTDLSSRDYFDLRRTWLAGQGPRLQRLAPFIDEQLLFNGRQLRLLGVDVIDLALSDNLPALQRQPGEQQIVRNGVWLSEDLQPFARYHNLPVNGLVAGDGVIVADIGVAQSLLGWVASDRLSYLGVFVDSPRQALTRWLERLAPGASAGLPAFAGPRIAGYETRAFAQQNPANSFGKSVLFNISALSMLALVVAWFLIYQVAVSWLRRLSGVFKRLWVLGCSYVELAAYFISLLLVFGLLAGVVGIWLGRLMADMLLVAIVGEQFVLPIDGWVAVKAVGSALAVCAIGGAWAFLRMFGEARSTPTMARTLVAALLLAAVIAGGVMFPATALVGAFASIAGLSLLLVFIMPWLLQLLKAGSRSLPGSLLLRMSVREVVWFPRDLSIAVSGLSLATATAIGVGLMIDAFREDFSQMLDQRLSYDYAVVGDAETLQAFAHQAGQGLLPVAVPRVQLYWQQQLRLAGTPVAWTQTPLHAQEAARYGFTGDLPPDAVLVSEQAARLLQLQNGSPVQLGGQLLYVAGVFKSFGELIPRMISHLDARAAGPAGFVLADVRLMAAPGTVTQLAQAYPGLQWQPQSGLRAAALQTFDQTFVITSVLIAIAVIVAGIGVYIAITVLRLNQRVSQRLLTGLGIARGEVWGVDFARGMGVGVLAGVCAVPLGLAIGWVLCTVVNPRAFGWSVSFDIYARSLLLPLGWAVLAAVVAGLTRVGAGESGSDRSGQLHAQLD